MDDKQVEATKQDLRKKPSPKNEAEKISESAPSVVGIKENITRVQFAKDTQLVLPNGKFIKYAQKFDPPTANDFDFVSLGIVDVVMDHSKITFFLLSKGGKTTKRVFPITAINDLVVE